MTTQRQADLLEALTGLMVHIWQGDLLVCAEPDMSRSVLETMALARAAIDAHKNGECHRDDADDPCPCFRDGWIAREKAIPRRLPTLRGASPS